MSVKSGALHSLICKHYTHTGIATAAQAASAQTPKMAIKLMAIFWGGDSFFKKHWAIKHSLMQLHSLRQILILLLFLCLFYKLLVERFSLLINQFGFHYLINHSYSMIVIVLVSCTIQTNITYNCIAIWTESRSFSQIRMRGRYMI